MNYGLACPVPPHSPTRTPGAYRLFRVWSRVRRPEVAPAWCGGVLVGVKETPGSRGHRALKGRGSVAQDDHEQGQEPDEGPERDLEEFPVDDEHEARGADHADTRWSPAGLGVSHPFGAPHSMSL